MIHARPAKQPSRRSFLPVFFSLAVLVSAVLLPVTIAWTQGEDDRTDSADPASGLAPSPGSPSSGPAVSGAASPSPTPDCAQDVLAGLGPRARAAQLMVVGVPLSDLGSGVSLVRRYNVGGVFLAGRSTAGVKSVAAAVARLQQASRQKVGIGLQVAVDQEGGQVQSLRGAGLTELPAALRQGAWAPDELTATTQTWAHELALAGVTWNLAPVADTVASSDKSHNPPIGRYDREYGSDPRAVAQQIRLVVTALQDRRIMATAKHFPGLGRVRANTDTATDAIDDKMSAQDSALLPFQAAIGAGSMSVMISSATYPQLDAEQVAAFSRRIVTDLLRTRLGFDGLVVSDDLGAAEAVSGVPLGQRATRFVAAGGDAVLTVRSKDAGPMINALVKRAQNDQEFQKRIDESALRVLRAKERMGLLTCR